MKRIREAIHTAKSRVGSHPIGKVQLTLAALREFAIVQYHDTMQWLAWFVIMRDMVTDPVVKTALQSNFESEAGNISQVSHMTLCLRFLRSVGLEPGAAIGGGVPESGKHAAAMIHMIPSLDQAQVAGWVLGVEDLVPDLFKLYLPHYERQEGVDTRYLTEHITVDTEDHAKQLLAGCESLLAADPSCINNIIFGVTLAERFTLSVPDAMLQTYGVPTPGSAHVLCVNS